MWFWQPKGSLIEVLNLSAGQDEDEESGAANDESSIMVAVVNPKENQIRFLLMSYSENRGAGTVSQISTLATSSPPLKSHSVIRSLNFDANKKLWGLFHSKPEDENEDIDSRLFYLDVSMLTNDNASETFVLQSWKPVFQQQLFVPVLDVLSESFESSQELEAICMNYLFHRGLFPKSLVASTLVSFSGSSGDEEDEDGGAAPIVAANVEHEVVARLTTLIVRQVREEESKQRGPLITPLQEQEVSSIARDVWNQFVVQVFSNWKRQSQLLSVSVDLATNIVTATSTFGLSFIRPCESVEEIACSLELGQNEFAHLKYGTITQICLLAHTLVSQASLKELIHFEEEFYSSANPQTSIVSLLNAILLKCPRGLVDRFSSQLQAISRHNPIHRILRELLKLLTPDDLETIRKHRKNLFNLNSTKEAKTAFAGERRASTSVPVAFSAPSSASSAQKPQIGLLTLVLDQALLQMTSSRFAVVRNIYLLIAIVTRFPQRFMNFQSNSPTEPFSFLQSSALIITEKLLKDYFMNLWLGSQNVTKTTHSNVASGASASSSSSVDYTSLSLSSLSINKGKAKASSGRAQRDHSGLEPGDATDSVFRRALLWQLLDNGAQCDRENIQNISALLADPRQLWDEFPQALVLFSNQFGFHSSLGSINVLNFLNASARFLALEQLLRFTPKHSIHSIYLKGVVSLANSNYLKAVNCFMVASSSVRTREALVGWFDPSMSIATLRPFNANEIGSGNNKDSGAVPVKKLVISFIEHLIELMEHRNQHSHVIKLVSNLLTNDALQDDLPTTLWTKLFTNAIEINSYELAYKALVSNFDPHKHSVLQRPTQVQRDCLRRFLVVLIKQGQWRMICDQFPFVGMVEEVHNTLESFAEQSDITILPSGYEILYCFHINRSDYFRAGRAMLQCAQRLHAESLHQASLTTLQRQANCYLAAINTFKLFDPSFSWLESNYQLSSGSDSANSPVTSSKRKQPFSSSLSSSSSSSSSSSLSSDGSGSADTEMSSPSDLHAASKKRRCMTVKDLEKKLCMTLSRLDVVKFLEGVGQHLEEIFDPLNLINKQVEKHNEDRQLIAQIGPQELLHLLIDLRLFDRATVLSQLFDLPLDYLFEQLAKTLKSTQELNMSELLYRGRRFSKLLELYLARFDNRLTNFHYHTTVAHCFLDHSQSLFLPFWFAQSFVVCFLFFVKKKKKKDTNKTTDDDHETTEEKPIRIVAHLLGEEHGHGGS